MSSAHSFAGVRGGYAQSKWVAERLVRHAGERGLPVRVYRPGRIVASAKTGAANPDDFALQVFRVCLDVGVAPDLDFQADATPVDYVAAAIAQLAFAPATDDTVFHLVNPTPLRPLEVAAWLRDEGFDLSIVDAREWWDALVRRVGADPRHRFYPLLPVLAGAPELAGGFRCRPAHSRRARR